MQNHDQGKQHSGLYMFVNVAQHQISEILIMSEDAANFRHGDQQFRMWIWLVP